MFDEAIGAQAEMPRPSLTEREREVLRAASLGSTNAEIATVLGVTVHTVKFHLTSIYRKLGAANRTDAIARAIRAGIDTAETVEKGR